MDASITVESLNSLRSAMPLPLIIDVRRAPVFHAAPDRIAGAAWRDPALVADWAGECARDARIIVYCVHGHEVSQNTAQALRERGLRAQFLEGGINAWRAAGGALTANSTPPSART